MFECFLIQGVSQFILDFLNSFIPRFINKSNFTKRRKIIRYYFAHCQAFHPQKKVSQFQHQTTVGTTIIILLNSQQFSLRLRLFHNLKIFDIYSHTFLSIVYLLKFSGNPFTCEIFTTTMA